MKITNESILIWHGEHSSEGEYAIYEGDVTEESVRAELKKYRDQGQWANAIQYRGTRSYGSHVAEDLETGSIIPWPSKIFEN